eukprot:gene37424-48948_t
MNITLNKGYKNNVKVYFIMKILNFKLKHEVSLILIDYVFELKNIFLKYQMHHKM